MLKPITNGDYLHEKIAKYSTIGDYEIKNSDIVAVYVGEVKEANFVAKFQFVNLCQVVKQLAFNRNIKYPIKIIRPATAEDGNLYGTYDKQRQETKFGLIVILDECDERDLDYLRNDENAMNIHETVAGGGVYRAFNG